MIKDILIFSQSGLPEKYTKWAVEALEEYMSWFPDYKDDFLIKNCDNYGGQDKLGIDWYEKAKISAAGKGHTGQVYADALFKHIKEDALLKNKPYLTVILLKDDLFTDGYAWIYGMGDRVKPSSGHIMSISRIRDKYGDDEEDVFKAILMHEFGHVCYACQNDIGQREPNKGMSDGTHCLRDNCLMNPTEVPEQFTHKNQGLYLAEILRQKRKESKPSLCDVCYAKVRATFALWSKNADRINKEVANFNKVIKSDREHTHNFFYDARGQIYTENNRLISSKRLQDLLGR